MTASIPIGEREDERREFKSARALARPESIAREVVAMLNAGGGEVWVGLRDEDGVAVELEPIDDAEPARRRLHDSLIDTIDPSPTTEEMTIDVVGNDVRILRIAVAGRRERRPYAVLQSGGGRVYVTRVGARIRHLSHEEIHRPADARRDDDARHRLEEDVRTVIEGASAPSMWVGFEPEERPVSTLDLDKMSDSKFLVKPHSTGNRSTGTNLYRIADLAALDNTRYLTREGGHDGLSWLVARGGSHELKVSERAAIRLLAPLDAFICPEELAARLEVLRGQTVLNPREFLEYPTSVFRLLSAMLRDDALWKGSRPSSFLVALTLVGVDGWYVRPDPEHPYLTYPVDPRHHQVPPEVTWQPEAHEGGISRVGPLSFPAEQLEQEPDECAYRLLRRVFADFGYAEDEIRAFDRKTRRFDFTLS